MNERHHDPHLEKGPIIPLPGKAIQAAVSKDFHTLAMAFGNGDLQRVLVWDLIANVQRGIFGNSRGDISKMEFSPDSSVLMVEWDQREIALWSITDDRALPSPPRDPLPDVWPAPFFAPHSTRLFTNRGTSKVLQMWDWSSGQLSTVYHAPLDGLWALGFSPNGSIMATGWGGEEIALTDTQDFRLLGALRGHTGYILSVAFSPSGRLMATASRDRTAKLWDPKTQNELATLVGNEQQLRRFLARGHLQRPPIGRHGFAQEPSAINPTSAIALVPQRVAQVDLCPCPVLRQFLTSRCLPRRWPKQGNNCLLRPPPAIL